MHFGTFQLTSEGINEPVESLRAECRARGVRDEEFQVPGFGASVVLR